MQVVRDGAGQIFSMNLDGSDAREFTRAGEGMPYGLSLSPDGRRVAYHLASPQGYQIWVSDADGGNRVKVVGDPEHLYFCPCWSPDGQWLAFQDCLYQQDPGHDWSDLFLSRPDGTEQHLLTKDQALWFAATYGGAENRGGGSNTPAWSHDGGVLCSHRLPGSKVAWEFQPQRPDTDHFNRDYKPELARGGAEICKIDPRDGSVTRITRPGGSVWDFRQSESPDGGQIVFCRAKTGGSPAIWTMNADGTDPRERCTGIDGRGADHPRWVPQARG
jgi:TolB protein